MKKYTVKATKIFEIEAVNAKDAAKAARKIITDKNFHLDITEQPEPESLKIKESDFKYDFDKDKFLKDLSDLGYKESLVPEIDVGSTKALKYFATDPVMWLIVVGDIVYDLNNMVIDYVICNIIDGHSEAYNKFYKNDYLTKFIVDCVDELEFSLGRNPDHYQLAIENIFKKWQYETLGIKE